MLCPEEGAVSVIEVHFLFVTLGVVGNPQFLGVGLETNINKSKGEDEGDGESG